ncbi:hypothetical protein BDV40DRAFT_260653 [Aspergillus tamarii]|uniref:Actin cytoskeleton-regulatory complex protein SLA1 n=1 Tax=Aspergillus tamarii TaxID=41984 RepID=A0A5N6V0P2_ASPTM|nr:hypothetical protein BDV40DRAFT_260653 [Aspergillus tamarii]
MGFLGVYTALYDYHPQAQGELELREGDLLYLLESNNEDDWWKAKKKAEHDDEDEPEGLVPNNYIEEAQPIHSAKALYDYTRQTDEEVSFSEDAELVVYDTSDPDWTLVGVSGDFGFAPANYIEIVEQAAHAPATSSVPSPPAEAAPPTLPQRPTAATAAPTEEASSPVSSSPIDTVQNPAAAAIADIIHKQHAEPQTTRAVPPPPQPQSSYEPEPSYQREPSPPPPALPQRPPSQQMSPRVESPRSPGLPPRPPQVTVAQEQDAKGHVKESPPYNRVGPAPRSPSGYHIYNVNEMVEVMGKRKKMPTTLGINIATGTIFISPEDDGEEQEWTADKLSHYSIEGKHVFVDLVRPSKSIDFHAGAKDTAREIVAALGEISGAYRAEGLREVIAAGSGGGGQKKGQILYDFVAQQDDEVGVSVGDEVIVLDDTKSEEWWMVRRVKNGKEGVVPSSYVEITGYASSSQPSGVDSGLSAVERNRLEESRLAKEALRKSRTDSIDSPRAEHQKRDSRSSQKSKPDPSKTRQWTDRTKTFTVEAQFIGLQDGKIHLHKMNGVKIAVPIPKMSIQDLEYVEKMTGVSLDEDKPLSDIKRRSTQREPEKPRPLAENKRPELAGASFQQSDYDWFDFFLKAGVGPHQCERYAQNFTKDSMDESILPDITPEVLRTLGLKEGDILRVMRHLDTMFSRTGAKSKLRNVSFGGEEVISNGEDGGGLFAGPGGVLRNNTRKGRPAPAVQTGDVVDPKAFEQKEASNDAEPKEASPTSAASEKPIQRGFDDDAWEVKQPKQTAPAPAPAPAAPAAPVAATPTSPPAAASPSTTQPPQQQLTGAMADLSVLHPPLQPTPTQPTPASQPPPASQAPPVIQPQPTAVPAPAPQQPQQAGATPGFFSQLGQPAQQPLQNPAQGFSPQATGFQQASRPRPQPPQTMGQNSLLPPPPQRPLSAPQNFPQQQSSFGLPPLQPQLTGLPQAGPPLAAPGQSLAELNQQRFQQPLQPQPTAFMPQNQFQNALMPQPTGFQPQSQFGIQQQQQQQAGFQGLAPQPTGFGFQAQPQQPMQTGINSVLPQPLQPQPTGMNGAGTMPYTTSPPPIPPIPQQPTAAPLTPQKTGPAPPIRFGVKHDAPKKLAPQPTGLRANLAQATPTNPFGF